MPSTFIEVGGYLSALVTNTLKTFKSREEYVRVLVDD